MATDFHCFLGYISHLINLLLMKVKVKCLFDFRFCLGIHLFWWHTMCFLHPFLSHQTWNKDNREGRQGRLSAFFFMDGEKKSLSSSCFFRGFYEVRRYSAIWGWWFWAVPGTCGRVRFPLLPTWMYPLFCTVHWKEPISLFSAAHILWPGLFTAFQKKT